MRNPKAVLSEWRSIHPVLVPIGSLKVDPSFQPRSSEPLGFRERSRWDETSATHVSLLRSRLAVSITKDLEPILAVDLGDGMYVVDGHHRLKAYQLAKRQQIPVRVLKASALDAVLVSKLVNFGAEKLPMLRQQAAEACWQYLAYVTLRGREAAPPTRSLESQFGISHQTVATMCRAIPTVNISDYGPAACDPGTGWPLWKHVRGNRYRMEDELSVDQKLALRAGRLAKQLAGLLDKADPKVVLAALDLLTVDASDPERKTVADDLRRYYDADGAGDPF